MKHLKNSYLAFFVVASALTITSCEEDLLGGFSEAETAMSDRYLATEAALSNIYTIVDNTMRDSVLRTTDTSMVFGAKVIRTGGTILIDFRPGVIGMDGRTRTGTISITETNDYRQAGGVLSVNLSSYVVDNFNVSGNLGLENFGADSLRLNVSRLAVVDSFELDGSKTVVWMSGFKSVSTTDDVYKLKGMATGKQLNNTLSSTILEPMVIDNTCQYRLLEGIVDMQFAMDTASAQTSGSIDFIKSDGCENLAKVKIKKGETEITLARQFFGF